MGLARLREGGVGLDGQVGDELAVLDFEYLVVGGDEAAVVGDDDEGGLAFGLEAAEDAVDFVAGAAVEFAGGFVGEEEFGLFDQGAGDGDALLLAAGEGAGAVVEAVAEADLFEQVDGAGAVFGGDAEGEEGDQDVFDGGEVSDQVEGLENEADLVAAVGVGLGFGHGAEVEAVDAD